MLLGVPQLRAAAIISLRRAEDLLAGVSPARQAVVADVTHVRRPGRELADDLVGVHVIRIHGWARMDGQSSELITLCALVMFARPRPWPQLQIWYVPYM